MKQTRARTYLWVAIACNRQVWAEGKVDRVGFEPRTPTPDWPDQVWERVNARLAAQVGGTG